MELAHYLRVLQNRKWIVILTMLIATAVVAVITARTPPTYAATTTLRVSGSTSTQDYGAFLYFERLANTFSDILTSELITNRAEELLGLEKLPDFSIAIISNTELMRLTVIDEDPQLAQTVANTLAQLLVEQNQHTYSSDESGVQSVLRARLTEIETDLNEMFAERANLENQIPRQNERIADIDRTIAALQQNYSSLQNTYNQAAVAQLSLANALTIIEPAYLPIEPEGPRVLRSVAVSSIIGLMGGIALAIIVESRSPRFYTLQQIEEGLNAQVVGKIPSIRRGYQTDVFAGDASAAEAFRRLRANLFAGSKSQPMRLLLVTSAIPKEGKSVVASNLASAIAQNGRKVLLVDSNMQQPTFERRYRLNPENAGLSNILKEETKLEEAVQESEIPNLSLLTAGYALANSSELLNSEDVCDLITRLLHYYDVIVFDGPAMLASTDSAVLAPYMSGVLWVIDPQKVDQRVAAFAREQLDAVGAPMVGIVANRVTKDESFNWVKHYRQRTKYATVAVKKDDRRSA